MKVRRRTAFGLGLVGILTVVAMAAASASSGSTSVVPKKPKFVLPGYVKNGTWNTAFEKQYPPYEYQDANGNPAGLDVDLQKAIAKVWGVKIAFHGMAFEAEIPSVANGRYSVVTVTDADTQAREQVVNFIDIEQAALTLMVQKGNPKNVKPVVSDLCGRTYSNVPGSYQDTMIAYYNQTTCSSKPINILHFTDTASMNQAVLQGRADFTILSSAVTSFYAKASNGALQGINKALPLPGGSSLQGWPIKKDLVLDRAVIKAIKYLMKTGQWQKIYAKWGAQVGELKVPLLNGKPLAGT
jgi:polar amino acid transport system substrate-binding protein